MAHYHVKSNTGNTIKDQYPHCVDTADLAVVALIQDLSGLALTLFDGCDREGCDHCGWCRSARQAQSLTGVAFATRIDTDLQGASGLVVDNPAAGPEGAYALWMERVPGQRGTCSEF